MMIETKNDLKFYLREDRRARKAQTKRPRPFADEIWRYQILLRKYEFYYNQKKKGPKNRMLRDFYHVRVHKLGVLLGFEIPPNVFGPGLCIYHFGSVAVNAGAKVGRNCRLQSGVCIGANGYDEAGNQRVPTLGDDVSLGPGAVVIGDVIIADGCYIGANAVVTKSFRVENAKLAGVPAKVIGYRAENDRLY